MARNTRHGHGPRSALLLVLGGVALHGCADDDSSLADAGGPVTTSDGGTAGADDPSADDPGAGDSGADETAGTGGVEGVPPCSFDLTPELERLHVPGLSAGIIADGRLVCTAVAGWADVEARRPVTPDTMFEWASVSKTITVTAAMLLHEEGRFDLDDDVGDYLPFAVRNPECPDTPITFRHLMTHTSSIIDNEPVYGGTYTEGDSPLSLGDFVRGYVEPGGAFYDAEDNFDFECAGSYSEYSNIAVGLLGHAVEQIAEQPFDDFCRERIFAPLGMGQASFHLANLDVDNIATPYEPAADGGVSRIEHVGYATYPDGLLRTSVPDLARFLAMMSGSGVYEGERMLAESTIEELKRIQFPALDETQGLVWYYDFDGALLGHDGSDNGASSLMFFDPETGDGALLVANGLLWDAAETEAYAAFSALMLEAADY
ncbi:MAG: serine hydrolase domain-containing protein [Myxococcota bacterium]